MGSAAEPTDEELVAFADSLLADLGAQLREPVVVLESVREHRELWVMLYEVTRNAAGGDGPESG